MVTVSHKLVFSAGTTLEAVAALMVTRQILGASGTVSRTGKTVTAKMTVVVPASNICCSVP